MKLSRAGDYGLRVVLELAKREPGAIIASRELSEMQAVPGPFLAKVVSTLASAGILGTRRGVSGGAWLAREPADITVLDVVEAIEGPIVLNNCLLTPSECDLVATCAIHDVWSVAQTQMREVLGGTDFAALAERSSDLTAGGRADGEPDR